MPEPLRILPLVFLAVVAPATASAHGPQPGIDGFYAGLTHPMATAPQVLALLALGLVLGRQWPHGVRTTGIAFVLGLGAGLAIALGAGTTIVPDWPLIGLALALGVLTAAARRLPGSLLVLLSAVAGVAIGIASLPGPGPWRAMAVSAAGSVAGASLAASVVGAGVAWLRRRFDRPWMQVGLRIAGSWVAAIACLVFALSYQSRQGAGRPVIFAASYPLAYFAGRLTGRPGIVRTLPADVETPARWTPGAGDLRAIRRAKLILFNGAGYEAWAGGVSLPRDRIVDTSAGFANYFIPAPAIVHRHGPGGTHAHARMQSATWLDMTLAVRQAKVAADAIVRAGFGDAAAVEKRYDALRHDLMAIDRRLSAAAKPLGNRPLMASAPVYGYLARRYRLRVRLVDFSRSDGRGAALWSGLRRIAAGSRGAVMLWPRVPDLRTGSRLAALGIRSVVVAPCDRRPARGDFMTCMDGNAEALERAGG